MKTGCVEKCPLQKNATENRNKQTQGKVRLG